MKKSVRVLVDHELDRAATVVGELLSRSTAQQIGHWASLGRELEASPTVSLQEVREVLGGSRTSGEVGGREQALVRSQWRERMETLRGSLRFDLEFEAEGRSYVELDDDGHVVERRPADTGGRAGGEDSLAVQLS